MTSGVKDNIPVDLWNKFVDMWSYGYEDDQFFELMVRGVFKLSNYYGNDMSQSRYNQNQQVGDSESQYSRP